LHAQFLVASLSVIRPIWCVFIMCYHKQQTASLEFLGERYSASYSSLVAKQFEIRHHETGFSFRRGPVITTEAAGEFQLYRWGFVPFWVKSEFAANDLRKRTLNCISEEMYEKPSFRDAVKSGRRCLIPCTGFFEWRHAEGGKETYPYFIHLKDQEVFSLAGLYSSWKDKVNGKELFTYTVLTTAANRIMGQIHNTKKRMPVIIAQDNEQDWLNPSLDKHEVNALCRPFVDSLMATHTVSKMLTDRKVENKNVAQVSELVEYAGLDPVV